VKITTGGKKMIFDWNNKTRIADDLWVLEDFLTPQGYNTIKTQMRCTESLWTSRYPNRLVMENNSWVECIQLGAALIPNLNELLGTDLVLSTARGYIDLSGSTIFPHFDADQFIINVQIYMTDHNHPDLGTQFCLDNDWNQRVRCEYDNSTSHTPVVVPEDIYYTVPFRRNWGYINDNRKPKVHKTKTVPKGLLRESLHLNFCQREGTCTGLEAVAEWLDRGEMDNFNEWQNRMSAINKLDQFRSYLLDWNNSLPKR
jgi:hypothetical protein